MPYCQPPWTYSMREPNTKRMQASIHASRAISPSAFGVLMVTLLKMLTKTRKIVTSSDMRPGITSGGITKETHEVITNSPESKKILDRFLRLDNNAVQM